MGDAKPCLAAKMSTFVSSLDERIYQLKEGTARQRLLIFSADEINVSLGYVKQLI